MSINYWLSDGKNATKLVLKSTLRGNNILIPRETSPKLSSQKYVVCWKMHPKYTVVSACRIPIQKPINLARSHKETLKWMRGLVKLHKRWRGKSWTYLEDMLDSNVMCLTTSAYSARIQRKLQSIQRCLNILVTSAYSARIQRKFQSIQRCLNIQWAPNHLPSKQHLTSSAIDIFKVVVRKSFHYLIYGSKFSNS